jgi:hypothetical protein
MKSLFSVFVLAFASLFACVSPALAGGKVDVKYAYSLKKEEQKPSVGLAIGQGLLPGIGWWTWNGLGIVRKEKTDLNEYWFSHQQGLDFSIGESLKFGPLFEAKFEEGSSKWDYVLGGKVSATLW